jgi:ATP-dependent Clp protease ATP-binding subunit ClpA
MFERFTKDAIKVIMLAQEEARRLGHNFVGTEQLLLGLIHNDKSIAGSVLKAQGLKLKDARVVVEGIIHRGSGHVTVEIPFTPRAKKLLENAWSEARSFENNYIGTEHLLLGLIKEGDGVACRVLNEFGIGLPALRQAILAHKDMNRGSRAHNTPLSRESVANTPDVNVEETSSCPNCLEVIVSGANLCRFCQRGLSENHYQRCDFCQEMIRKGAKLCRYCKSNVSNAS